MPPRSRHSSAVTAATAREGGVAGGEPRRIECRRKRRPAGSPKPGTPGLPPVRRAAIDAGRHAAHRRHRDQAGDARHRVVDAEAAPVSWSSTAVMTAVDSGETTSAMPSPISTISGKTPVQNWWMPAAGQQRRGRRRRPPTTRLPAAIGRRGPMRSAKLPTGPRQQRDRRRQRQEDEADLRRARAPSRRSAASAGRTGSRRQREIEEEGRDIGAGEGARCETAPRLTIGSRCAPLPQR